MDDSNDMKRAPRAVKDDRRVMEQIVQVVESDDEGPPPPTTTPSKRKRQTLEAVIIPVRQNSRSTNKTRVQGAQEKRPIDLGPISPDSSLSSSPSPSPPPSPSQRNSKRSRVGVTSSIATPSQEGSRSSNGIDILLEKRPPQQATLSSFFAPKAGRGTGILKGTRILKSRTTNANGNNKPNDSGDGDGNGSSDENNIKTGTPTPASSSSSIKPASLVSKKVSSVQEPPKKLEQLFLSFSKDRTKKSPSSSKTTTSTGTTTLSTRKPTTTRLSREDEKSKRHHCPQCGMPYVRGQPEDEQIHDRYHRAIVGGIDYPGYKNEVVVAIYNDVGTAGLPHSGSSGGTGGSTGSSGNSRIVMVSMSDTGKSTTSSSVSSASSFEKKKVR